ncbi:MAG: hypothetical protein RQ750_02655 [Roseovarius sp.]|nr:hypothetical protein [Roseovarius sp.]
MLEVAPAAKPARMRFRHWMIVVGFVAFTITPALGAAYYLYTHAADQYASTVGFTVRREENGSAMEILGGLTQISGASSSDTDILYEFVQSQKLVRDVDEALDLQSIFQKPKNDPIFSLTENASIEDLLDYWERMVRIQYDPGAGLIEIEVRAFDPNDAQLIAQELFDRSSAMINELSSIARTDMTGYAKEELDQAMDSLKTARQALREFRNETQIVDPAADIQGQMGLLNSLQARLADALIELDLLNGITSQSDPRAEQARKRIEVIETRISEERLKLGVVGTNSDQTIAFADLFGEFESLQMDLEFAEKAYVSALSAYNASVAEARRKSRYLAAYLQPTLAETPRYPQRLTILAVLTTLLFGLWTIIVLVYYSLRDRR